MSLVNNIANAILAELVDEFLNNGEVTYVDYGAKLATPGLDILVHWGGQDDPDELNTTKRDVGGKLSAPTHEIGGGMYIWRKFRIEFQFHRYTGTKPEARDYATDIESRSLLRIKNMDMPTFSDSQYAIQNEYVDSYMLEEGGVSTPFIWRGEMRYQFLTFVE